MEGEAFPREEKPLSKEHGVPRGAKGRQARGTRANAETRAKHETRRPLKVPPISFEHFRRNKEREHQGAPVYDTRSARSGVLQCFRKDNRSEVSERPTSGRPSTRQSERLREAEAKLGDQKKDEQSILLAQREQLKQEYWQEYNEAGSAKKTLSDFEEWQRLLHEASTTASEDQDVMSVEDSEFRISHLGFTRRSEHEEYVSDYYRRCRERHYIPLGPRREGDRSVEVEQLQFGGWSLGSERLEMLCQAGAVECRRCDLSGNRIQDRSVSIICDKLLPRAEALNLSSNFIGHLGIRHFEASLRKITMSPLLELNLQANRLGMPPNDAYERDLCNFVDALSTRTPELRALSLAQNGLGRVNHELGKALGSMIMELKFLRVLDLHWNSFHGLGAYKIFEGIMENGSMAQLSRVDLSWNRIGERNKVNPSKMLAEVLRTNSKLFHLDVSYNAIATQDCELIAEGLRYNKTLFGFHVAGNEAFVDELGFMVPLSDPCRLRLAGIEITEDQEPRWTAEEAASHVFGREVQHPSFPVAERGGKTICWDSKVRPPKKSKTAFHRRRKFPLLKQKSLFDGAPKPEVPWEDWEETAYSMPLAQSFQRGNLEEIALRAERCWICDRYQPVKITWTPSISSPQLEEEVHSVHAYMSSDDFTQPTLLKMVKPENQAGRFVGHRMVPQNQTLLVIFRVNGVIEAANDLPIRLLPCPVTVPEDEGEVKASPETCHWANELPFQDRPVPLIVTEDSVVEGKLEVYPRTVEEQQEVEMEPWDKSQSVFASWRVAQESLYEKMLKMDLKFCRVAKFAPEQDLGRLQSSILPIYPKMVAIYRKMSCWSDKHQVFGVSLHQLQSLLRRGRVFDRNMQAEHLPSMVFASNVVERRFAEAVTIFSDSHLIRYQFMETLLRVAEAKYIRCGKTDSLGQAMKLLCAHFESEMAPIYEEELQFQQSLFTEEVDYVFKSNLNLLNAAYNIYAGITDVPDSVPYAPEQLRGKRKITLPDFFELLEDCDVYDQRFLRAHSPRAFGLASIYEVDEVSLCNHMSLNFVEFLVSLGAVVFRKEAYSSEEFADLLEELLLDQVKPVVLEYRARNGQQDDFEGIMTHKDLKNVCKAIFEVADEDGNQTLTVMEFGSAMRDARTKELFKGKEFRVREILNAFGALDEDGSGELNFAEVMHGIGALLKVAQNEPRVRAFLRKELNNEDGKGQFTISQLLTFLNKGSTQRKFMRVGIEMKELSALLIHILEIPKSDRIEKYLETMFSSESATAEREKAVANFEEWIFAMGMSQKLFSCTEFMEEVMRLRKPKPIPRWKILIKEIFEKADVDKCGTLTNEEFVSALQSPGTQSRLEALGLDLEEVQELFEIIDVDGSDDVTEAEMVSGIEALMELKKESDPDPPDLEQLRLRVRRYDDIDLSSSDEEER